MRLDDTRDVQNLLDSEDHFWHKVSVLRLEESVGLMMARQAGVDRSTANYFAILDSHMEVAEGRYNVENCSKTLCILVLFAENFCKQFGLRSSPTKRRA